MTTPHDSPAGMRTIEVHVTAEDIERGITRDELSCPIALATGRATGQEVHVYQADIEAEDPRSGLPRWRVPHPDSIKSFIEEFDNDRPVSPFTFTLAIPAS